MHIFRTYFRSTCIFFLFICNLIVQMTNRHNWMIHQHSRSRKAHHFSYLFSLFCNNAPYIANKTFSFPWTDTFQCASLHIHISLNILDTILFLYDSFCNTNVSFHTLCAFLFLAYPLTDPFRFHMNHTVTMRKSWFSMWYKNNGFIFSFFIDWF